MKTWMLRLVREEEGQDLIEYALLVTLVAIVVAIGATALGTNLNTWYGGMATNVSGLASKVGS
jgi:Flp pilus assembly pilin Flp